MRCLSLSLAALALVAPLPALAQDAPDLESEEAAARVAQTLGDPLLQSSVAAAAGVAGEVLLDLPLAPLARAVAQAAGEDPAAVDPDLTLRRVAPEAERMPGEMRESVPRVMGAMADMAGGFGAMMPALREMAERMRAAVEVAGARTPD